jgi:hypothetical protein
MAVPLRRDRNDVRPSRDVGADEEIPTLLLQGRQHIGLASRDVSHLRARIDVIAPTLAFGRQVARALEPIAFECDLPAVLAAQPVDERR